MARRPNEQDPIVGRTEALGNGLTFGFGGEMGAGIQGELSKLFNIPSVLSGEKSLMQVSDEADATKADALKENNSILAQQRQAEPYGTLAIEALGGTLVPVPGGAAASGATRLARAGRAAAVGLGAGALAGAGNAEPGARLEGAATGGTLGAIFGPLLAGGFHLAGKGLSAGAERLEPKMAELLQAMGRRFGNPNMTDNYEAALQHGGHNLRNAARANLSGAMTPEQEAVVPRAREMLSTWQRGRIAENRPLPQHHLIDQDTGETLLRAGEPEADGDWATYLEGLFRNDPPPPSPAPGQTARYYDPGVKELRDVLTPASPVRLPAAPAAPTGPSDTVPGLGRRRR
jgi:hypothetical protein